MLIDDIRKGESPTLEFKRGIPDQALKYLKIVSAFANCSVGRIVFGVDSDGSICGMDEPFAARDKIADSIANGIGPAEKWGLAYQMSCKSLWGMIWRLRNARIGAMPYEIRRFPI